MREAVATSLLVLTSTPRAPLVARAFGDGLPLDWSVIAPFTVATVLGSFVRPGSPAPARPAPPALLRDPPRRRRRLHRGSRSPEIGDHGPHARPRRRPEGGPPRLDDARRAPRNRVPARHLPVRRPTPRAGHRRRRARRPMRPTGCPRPAPPSRERSRSCRRTPHPGSTSTSEAAPARPSGPCTRDGPRCTAASSTRPPRPSPSAAGSRWQRRRGTRPRRPGSRSGSPPAWHFRPPTFTTVSCLLGELPAAVAGDVVDAALAASSTSVLVVEPGTPRGYAAVLAARDRALAAGGASSRPVRTPAPVR